MAALIPSPMPPATEALTTRGPIVNSSLYVGDLDASVNEGQLFDLFSQVAQVVSIRICRDQTKRSSLGYAYVNFINSQDAANAKELLNFTPLNGKPIRIMFSQRDPSVRKSGSGNVFVKNLDKSIDHKALHDIFAFFGSILSCKVALDGNGQSKGYGFIQFDNEESAKNAIEQLNGMLLNDKQVYVGSFVCHQERDRTSQSPKFTNVYIKNLSERLNDDDLKQLFSPFGTITSARVMKDTKGKSRCFGFVNFKSPDSAAAAVEKLNGTTVNGDKVLFVGRAQSKAEREQELKAKIEQERISRYEKLQRANLYLKNLDDDFTNEKLKDMFSKFGTITSCKVMMDSRGHSTGSGFVAFSTPEEADKAMNEMNGKFVGRKPLFVAVAQRKEERKAQLQAHFAEIVAHGGLAPPAARIHAYYPEASRLASQQGQGTYDFIPPQSNFVMPYQLQRQGQKWQRKDAQQNGNLQHVHQNQVVHRDSNLGFRYMANDQNDMDSSGVPHGLVGRMLPMTFDSFGVTAPIDNQCPESTSLASALASATPENQRMMLGEHLYPLVERLTAKELATKVTGMLLEMDQAEVINLIESPDDLKRKVSEALQVLHEAALESKAGDQLGSLSLNE